MGIEVTVETGVFKRVILFFIIQELMPKESQFFFLS